MSRLIEADKLIDYYQHKGEYDRAVSSAYLRLLIL